MSDISGRKLQSLIGAEHEGWEREIKTERGFNQIRLNRVWLESWRDSTALCARNSQRPLGSQDRKLID